LAFNLIGTVCSINNTTHSTIDVVFHDSAQRPFHFTDDNQYLMGCLGTSGAVFASEATATLPSVIHYRPLDSWSSKNEWTIELPSGENAKALAINDYTVAVCTEKLFLRIFSLTCLQLLIKCVPGPILTMAGGGSLLMVIYHAGGVFHGISDFT
jgi:chromosome transmission fidelity protein 4